MPELKDNAQVIISVIKDETEKGHQTLQCSVSNGFAVNSKPTYVLSTPAAIEANKLKVGTDITALCKGMMHVETRSIDETTGEELVFNWLTV